MFEMVWEEINSKDQIVSKRKAFKTKEALEKFADKVTEKDSFYRMIAYAD